MPWRQEQDKWAKKRPILDTMAFPAFGLANRGRQDVRGWSVLVKACCIENNGIAYQNAGIVVLVRRENSIAHQNEENRTLGEKNQDLRKITCANFAHHRGRN